MALIPWLKNSTVETSKSSKTRRQGKTNPGDFGPVVRVLAGDLGDSALTQTSCITLGKSLNLSGSQ